MTRKTSLVPLPALAWLLLAGAPAPAEELKIEKGFDLFRTLPEHESEQSFADCPVPGLTFETRSDQPLTGCSAFDGFVRLAGRPLESFRGVTVGAIDTIVERKQTLDFGMPIESTTLTTPVELVALNLASASPIEVACDQGITKWFVEVEVDASTGPSLGQMDVTLNHPELAGGKVESDLEICPRVTFTRVDPGGSGSFEIYPCDLLCGPQLVGETAWSFTPPPGAADVLKIPGFTTDGFYFVDPPSTLLSSGFRSLARRTAAAAPLNCECGFLYPHLSETHRHQACSPCPCDADIVAPVLNPPATPVPPFECTGRNAGGQGGIRATDPHAAGWLGSAVCSDATSPIESCGPVSPPAFFPLGLPESPPAHCVGRHPVSFRAVDQCENETRGTATFQVQDTRGPVVASGEGVFECLTPRSGGVQCYTQDEDSPAGNPFEFEAIRQAFTSDLCSDVADWWFTGCASDQADDGQGDGNTTGDCVVAPDRRSFCVRAERDPRLEAGRRYSVEIQARDECGNTGEPQVVGFVHVPQSSQGGTCREVAPCRPECLAEPTAGSAPLPVSFRTRSNCPVDGWAWNFGDGATSSEPNPSHTFDASGTYNPTVTVSDGPLSTVVACPSIEVEPATSQSCPTLQVQAGGHDFSPVDIAAELGLGGNVTVTAICQDELVMSNRGDQAPDGRWPDPAVAEVRGERDGRGDGRVYHIFFQVDGQEPECAGALKVCIPHGGPNEECGDGGSLYDSTSAVMAPCPR